MSVTKRRMKTDQKQRIKIKLSTKWVVSGAISLATFVILFIIHSGTPLLSKAKSNQSLKIINLEDQAFTNQTEIPSIEIKPVVQTGKNTIFIKKVKSNIQP